MSEAYGTETRLICFLGSYAASFSPLSFASVFQVTRVTHNATAHRDQHRESTVQEEAGDTQVHKVRQGLSAKNLAGQAPKARVRRGAQGELSVLWQKVHAQVQVDPPLGLVQKKTRILRDDIEDRG